nr:putative methyltransferase C9orf114 homolog [Parasteatoda tepidariorum]
MIVLHLKEPLIRVFAFNILSSLHATLCQFWKHCLNKSANNQYFSLYKIYFLVLLAYYSFKFFFIGEIHPLQLPSHLSINDESEYREGIVLNKPVKQGKGSYINIGLQKPAVIDKILKENVRVTVKLDKEQFSKKHFKGKAVSPTAPLKNDNIYWGYSVRLAKSFNAIFSESPYAEGYDVTVGTSDKGRNVDHVKIPKFNHLLIVFGGLKGIEACLEDEAVEVDDPKELFDYYLNVCPIQGTKTIRTEEAILATLATLRPRIYELQGILNDT